MPRGGEDKLPTAVKAGSILHRRPYGEAHIVDAHHIDPFSTSKNNNFDNVMVVCPSHHRIIHACHGRYRRQLHEIWYPNGLHEPLQLNLHL